MARNNKGVKIMALLALFGLIIGIISTGILVIINGGQKQNGEQTLSPEQYKELQNLIKENSGTISDTGTGINIGSGTGLLTGTGTESGSGKIK